MPPPPPLPRLPPTVRAPDGPPIPEFMWCQRSDRVYLTIKVADCMDASIDVSADSELKFSGHGHGARGTRDYALNIRLAGGVIAEDSRWFVCGPSVRVRLEKANPGPYWDSLLPRGEKLPQCKVDWQSWIDEDEETEVSAAPNGFEVNDMQMQMVGESIEFYRDRERLSSSEEEGEETDSIMMDQGLNSMDQLSDKFKALEIEKEARKRSKAERRQLRERTLDAQSAAAQRERDLRYNRPARELTAEELDLIQGAPTLRARLKAQKAAESRYWLSRPHHQMRPKQDDVEKAAEAARKAAKDALAQRVQAMAQVGVDALLGDENRKLTRHAIREAALEAAYVEVGYKDAAPVVAHEVAAAAAREVMGEPPPRPIEAAAEAMAEAAAEAAGLRYSGIRPPVEDVVAQGSAHSNTMEPALMGLAGSAAAAPAKVLGNAEAVPIELDSNDSPDPHSVNEVAGVEDVLILEQNEKGGEDNKGYGVDSSGDEELLLEENHEGFEGGGPAILV